VCACVHACVHAYVRACVRVFHAPTPLNVNAQVEVGEDVDFDNELTEGVLESIRRSAASVLPWSKSPRPVSKQRDGE